ncbi:MAG TPA: metallopeptidase TldD-related protein [Blastocatellia bacterium]|nr:metallopeptidase TldD-related protein [Blastocatellia bacterium]
MTTEDLARMAVETCRQRGAAQADALVIDRREKAVQVFNHESPLVAESDTTRLTLRLFSRRRGAIVTGNGNTEKAIESMVGQAMGLIGRASRDKFLGLADPGQLGAVSDDLGLYDEALAQISLGEMRQIVASIPPAIGARDAKAAALASSSFQVQVQEITVATSEGYSRSYRTSAGTLSANLVLGAATTDEGEEGGPEGKLTGGANLSHRALGGLKVDRLADLAVGRLSEKVGAQPAASGSFPVVFAPTASRSLAGILLQFCSGPVAMYMQGSYFGKLGETICSRTISLVDDPLRVGGLKSQPFDHEGVVPRRKVIIRDGVFSEFLLNAYYARVLDRESTGNAISNEDIRLGVAPSNAYIDAGSAPPESIIADLRQGFYVTRLISRVMRVGANFTQAATGRWIEGGKLSHAVRAAIISAPLKEMFKNVVACGNDLNHEAALAAPTMLVSKMSISPLT